MSTLEDFLLSIERRRIFFRLERIRADAVAVMIAVPGERWEVEFFEDGRVEAERFVSDGQIHDESALVTILSRFSE